MSRPPTPVLVVLLAVAPPGCAPPAENPEFDDATAFLFREFETERPERLAYALRGLDERLESRREPGTPRLAPVRELEAIRPACGT